VRLIPGATIGILGAGQLGRMIALAAARLGLRAHIFAPEGDAPALDVVGASTKGAFEDEDKLAAFAEAVDVVTYESENVPAASVAFLEARRPVRPGGRALAITQDRLTEKTFLRDLGVATAPFMAIDDAGAVVRAVAALGRPSIIKTRRFGYDGKGQALVREGSNLPALYRSLNSDQTILEGFVPFEREISVVAARGIDGEFVAFDVCENEHEKHVLARTFVPARIRPETEAAAIALARKIIDALDYVGVIGVEMFVVRRHDGSEDLVVNELAPRVHNSGHWTLDGARTSQFEQHVRAIAGWPLGATTRLGRIEMHNLIGEDANSWLEILGEPGLSLHLYGKLETRPGRKMGHVTKVIAPGP
jgi:5-(carboxyamino)imidazole ribonucleotide synthase